MDTISMMLYGKVSDSIEGHVYKNGCIEETPNLRIAPFSKEYQKDAYATIINNVSIQWGDGFRHKHI